MTSTFAPTPEQQSIIDFAKSSSANILISALAGAAKTTTLELIVRALPVQPILCLAFNKKIALEMAARLPGHVKCQTMNAIGHGVWRAACGRNLKVEAGKTYTIVKALVDSLKRQEKADAYETFGEVLKLVQAAKLAGYIPASCPTGKRLISCEDFWALQDDDLQECRGIVDRALIEAISQSYSGTIDFDDQVYMPTLFGGTFPRFPLILGDEVQDFSALNIAMLEKLVVGRFIGVGDPWQSIYAFRGALTTSMETLRVKFSMTPMPLSISFRCPKAIVARAQLRAPHMRAPDWAEEGSVSAPHEWNASLIPDGAAVICRNNAPLYSIAFKLIRAGRGVTVLGSDIGPALVKALKKLGENLDHAQLTSAIDAWEIDQLRKKKGKAAVKDKAECLRVFADIGGDLNGAIAYAESIFASKGPITFLSGHKSKGLEWDNVFHLDPGRIPSPFAEGQEEIEQEFNIQYVIETRAKRSLTLINFEDFIQ